MKSIRTLFLVPLFVALQASGVSPQETGSIIGRVVDAGSAVPLTGVQVSVNDGEVGTLTDMDGRFVLSGVPAGPVSLRVQSLGYGTKTVTDLVVVAGEVTLFNLTLEEEAVAIEGITVSAEFESGSASALLDQRKTAIASIESVGSAEISRRPDGDAAEVAKRLTGVTVTDGKYVFVRGLGERYSQTSLNGSSLPSPEPERDVVPLDIFPSGFLESLSTQKTYTPDLPADFSGGTVQIKTKDFPDRFTIRASVGSSMNSNSQFENGFLNFNSGGRDWLGLDDGSRDQPAVVRELMGGVRSGGRLPTDPAQRLQIAEALRSTGFGFAPGRRSTPLNRNFALSIGGRGDVFEEGEIGYFVAGTYADSYTIQGGGCAEGALQKLEDLNTESCREFERKWRNSAFQEGTTDFATPNVDFAFERGTRNVAWGTVGNFTVKLNPRQKLSLQTTVNLTTDDEARRYRGENAEDIGGLVEADRSRWVERLLLWSQLSGEHLVFGGSQLEWRASLSRAERDEPLLREVISQQNPFTGEFTVIDFSESGKFFFSELIDDDASLAFDWRFPFDLFDRGAAVKFGALYRKRDRDFGARRLNFDFLSDEITDFDEALADATLVDGPIRSPDQFGISEIVEPGDVYQADDERIAGYLMFELPVTRRLQAVVGARVENYSLGVDSRGVSLQETDETDLAPSLTLIHSPTDDIRIRASVSRTVDRPEFRELAPFQFTEAASLRQLFGNPDLESATVESADLRLDFFPGAGELLSIGGFYKKIDEPIEQVFIQSASTAFSFQNADQAEVIGIETDAQIRLGRFLDLLDPFSIQGNFSYIDSEVDVRADGGFDPTSLERPLEGQAEYVLNAGLNYSDVRGLDAGIFFNRFGDRVSAAGGGGVPDIVEQPRNALDATLGFPLPRGVRASIKASNILDDAFVFEQSLNGFTQIQRKFSLGRNLSVGLSWEF
ncbi:MAG: TonB-dependent receptor [Longimicrobiales bacterium]|nr:TonB-dependent receptor [Longimicrobiales bacterium]